MTELERQVVAEECNVAEALLELQQAELELSHGGRHLEEAKEKYGKLKIAVEIKKLQVRRCEAYLQRVKTDAEKGFVGE
jgi:hypothetical protein